MATIEQIKSLMKSGDVAGAEALCRKALEADSGDAQLSLYLATCRQLQGDEAEFRRIVLEIAPRMEALQKADPDSETARLWRKSGAVLMEYIVLGVLVVAAVVGGVIVFGEKIQDRYLYGPAQDMFLHLYGPAIEIERELEPQPQLTNAVESQASALMASTNAADAVVSGVNEASPEEQSLP